MKYHVRCSKKTCQKRRVLAKHPEGYFKFDRKKGAFINKAPACEGCGGNAYRIDGWMSRRDTHSTSCECSGYVHLTRRLWPHRKGSKYCWYRADGSQRYEGDGDFHDSQMEEFLYNQRKESS